MANGLVDPYNAFLFRAEEIPDGALVVAVDDLIDVAGMPTTSGGPAELARHAEADAPVIANLRRSGAAIAGKTNLSEWAYGVSSENPNHGPVVNPRAPLRSAGGSSSGSAAAVAGGLCDWAVGTDTAGSVRIPAGLCGVVGLKPTRGLLPNAGVQPLSPSQDAVGVLAPSVAIAAAGLRLLAGLPAQALEPLAEPPRLAVPARWLTDLDAETASAWEEWAAALPPIRLPEREEIFGLAQTIETFEAARVHRRAIREDPGRFDPETLMRLRAGSDLAPASAEAAVRRGRKLAQELDVALSGCDALVLPTTACVAPPVDADQAASREPLTRFTRPFNLTGQPAISLPLAGRELPVGLQLVGSRGTDAQLLSVAAAVERTLLPGAGVASAPS